MYFSLEFSSIFALLGNIVGIAAYVFMGIGLMTIAKNRGYDKPWLSWIPFCNLYLLGKVADDIMIRRGKKTSYGKTLVGLGIASAALFLVFMAVCVFVVLEAVEWGGFGHSYYYGYDYDYGMSDVTSAVIGAAIIMLLSLLAILTLMIIQMVFLFIALGKIFSDYDPANATLYTVLSVISSILGLTVYPIFLFVIRNRLPISIYAPPAPYAQIITSYNIYQQPNFGPAAPPPYQQVPPQNYYAPASPQMPPAPPYPGQQWQAPPVQTPPVSPYRPQGWQPAPPPQPPVPPVPQVVPPQPPVPPVPQVVPPQPPVPPAPQVVPSQPPQAPEQPNDPQGPPVQ